MQWIPVTSEQLKADIAKMQEIEDRQPKPKKAKEPKTPEWEKVKEVMLPTKKASSYKGRKIKVSLEWPKTPPNPNLHIPKRPSEPWPPRGKANIKAIAAIDAAKRAAAERPVASKHKYQVAGRVSRRVDTSGLVSLEPPTCSNCKLGHWPTVPCSWVKQAAKMAPASKSFGVVEHSTTRI